MTSQQLTDQSVSAPATLNPSLPKRATHWLLDSSAKTAQSDAASAVLRLGLAAVILPHGLQKTVGAFGGYGWSGTMGFFTETMGLPAPVAAFTILLELIGPFLLLAGFATRAVALGFIGIMLGAIVTVHGQFGFFMNWFGQQAGEGFEYHLLIIALAAGLVFLGAGRVSIDQQISKRLG